MKIDRIWSTNGVLLASCSYDFDSLVCLQSKNKYIPGKNKFSGAEKILARLAFLEK